MKPRLISGLVFGGVISMGALGAHADQRLHMHVYPTVMSAPGEVLISVGMERHAENRIRIEGVFGLGCGPALLLGVFGLLALRVLLLTSHRFTFLARNALLAQPLLFGFAGEARPLFVFAIALQPFLLVLRGLLLAPGQERSLGEHPALPLPRPVALGRGADTAGFPDGRRSTLHCRNGGR